MYTLLKIVGRYFVFGFFALLLNFEREVFIFFSNSLQKKRLIYINDNNITFKKCRIHLFLILKIYICMYVCVYTPCVGRCLQRSEEGIRTLETGVTSLMWVLGNSMVSNSGLLEEQQIILTTDPSL